MAVSSRGRIFVANTSFNCDPWGWVYIGDTVREGHPILEGRETYFDVRKNEAKFEHDPKPTTKK
jgi:hypothetical protein